MTWLRLPVRDVLARVGYRVLYEAVVTLGPIYARWTDRYPF